MEVYKFGQLEQVVRKKIGVVSTELVTAMRKWAKKKEKLRIVGKCGATLC